jgi:hypothetical protein
MGQSTSSKLQNHATDLTLLQQNCEVQAATLESEVYQLELTTAQHLRDGKGMESVHSTASIWGRKRKEAQMWRKRAEQIERVVSKLHNMILMHSYGTEMAKLAATLEKVNKLQDPAKLLETLTKVDKQLTEFESTGTITDTLSNPDLLQNDADAKNLVDKLVAEHMLDMQLAIPSVVEEDFRKRLESILHSPNGKSPVGILHT